MHFVCGACYSLRMSEFAEYSALDDIAATLLCSSFVLRLYREGETGSWRGEVLHLQSQDKRRIATLAQIYDFLSQHTPGLDQENDSNISVLPVNQ